MRFGKTTRQDNRLIVFKLTLTPVIILSLCLTTCLEATDAVKKPAIIEISSGHKGGAIERPEGSEYLGPIYPKYQFKIYEDGLVVYNGELEVNVIGERRAKITPSQAQELTKIFMKIYNRFDHYELFGKNKQYLSREDPYLIQLDYQGKKLNFSPGSFVDFLLADLNRSTPIENWLCPRPNSSSHTEDDVDCRRHFKHAVSIQEYIDKHP